MLTRQMEAPLTMTPGFLPSREKKAIRVIRATLVHRVKKAIRETKVTLEPLVHRVKR